MVIKKKDAEKANTQSSWVIPASVSLLAFAANSLFCRLALIDGDIDPQSFTAIRLGSGGAFLLLLMAWKMPGKPTGGSWKGGALLFLYAYLFSMAYVELGAGVGALILFGAVQITMFTVSWLGGERIQAKVMIGMLIAFTGLIALLLPGADTPVFSSSMLMVISGAAWGVYSLIGKKSTNPTADTTGNFIRSLPFLACLVVAGLLGGEWHMNSTGTAYALASGVLASGAGYATWYGVVKRITGQQAATLQLSVPIIASIGGVIFLGEPVTSRLVIVSIAVLGGVALTLAPSRHQPR